MKTLKYFIYMLSVLLCAGFSSCSDDDDISSNDLVGTWEIVTAKGWIKENDKIADEWDLSAKDNWEELTDDYDRYMEFTEDGEVYDGDNLNQMRFTGDWELESNKLYIYEGGGGFSATILKLNSSELVLELFEVDQEEGDKIEYYDKITYKKSH